MSIHTLSVLVENKPGVLARVAALFSRRGFNIHSLAVGPTEHPDVSRMTIVVNCADLPLEQVTKQLNKLVNVLLEATGAPDKLEALIRMLEPYGIKELVQSGIVGIARGGRSMTAGNDRALRSTERLG